MADFSLALPYLLSNEDYAPTDPRYGKVNTDNDGGLVRFGVNSKSLGKALLNTTFYTSMDNASALKEASNLYNTRVWPLMRGDDLHSQRVADKILDLSVNSGVVEATKLTQRAANVNVDGQIGPITVNAINATLEDAMLTNLVFWWNWLVTQILKNNPNDHAYEKDWRARADKLPT